VAEPPRVGVLIPNAFLRLPVEQLVRSLGAEVVPLAAASALQGAAVLLADGESVSDAQIQELVGRGCAVVVFAAPGREERLGEARRAGAVALPRLQFLLQLPDILWSALGVRGKAPGEGRTAGRSRLPPGL
jgi:hypothetical protein